MYSPKLSARRLISRLSRPPIHLCSLEGAEFLVEALEGGPPTILDFGVPISDDLPCWITEFLR